MGIFNHIHHLVNSNHTASQNDPVEEDPIFQELGKRYKEITGEDMPVGEKYPQPLPDDIYD